MSIPAGALAARSQKIVDEVQATSAFQRARSVVLFWPMLEKNEVDVRALDGAARDRGKGVAYPYIEGDFEMSLRLAEASSLVERGNGFAEPPDGAPQVTADEGLLVVVPALAVDPTGQRIGYGKGFYDRLLARIHPPAFTVAVVYDFEVVPEVPATEHDRPVDMVVTDARAWEIAASQV